MASIEVLVSPRGETVIQTKGFAGESCLQASRSLEQALGLATDDRKTAEFFQATAQEQQIQQ